MSAMSATRPRMDIGQVRAVIFDMDGVLVNSFEVMREAFDVAYREAVDDGDPPFEEYTKHLGRYFPDILQDMGLPLAMEAPFVRESLRRSHRVAFYKGVRELVVALRAQGLRLAVATGKAKPRARSLLAQLGALHLFDQVVGSDEVSQSKPAPDIVLRSLDLLGVRRDQAVMVGDAVADLQSARAAGVAAIAAVWGTLDEAALLAAEPDAVVRTPADLLALV